MNTGPLTGVSVVMPVLNEAKYLSQAVSQILNQQVSVPIEVVLAVGPSTDETELIAAELAAADNRVVVVANPTGKTPAALNLAIAIAKFDVIVRVDGHAILPTNYIQTAIDVLQKTNADVVGGVMAAAGVSNFEVAVAAAMRSALGVGSASFHTGGDAGPALTVYLGVFRRSALDRVGGYDESFIRAQDWELNYRIRQSGGLIWFDPRLEVTYRPRSTVKALAKQYFNYGKWRREVARTYPATKSLRYLAPPLTVLALISSAALLVLNSILDADFSLVLLAPIAGYLSLILIGSVVIFNKKHFMSLLWQPVVLLTMHMCWGAGFLTSPKNLRAR
jgi:glycosyltransferase involved in cell wall biosynthesis